MVRLRLSGKTREIGRKIIQVGFGIVVVLGMHFWSVQYTSLTVAAFAVLFLIGDLLMIELGWSIPIWKQLEREHERITPHAATYTLLGAAFALAFYQPLVALAAIAAQSFGDTAASMARGFRPFKGKRLNIWMLVVTFATAYLITKSLPISIVVAVVAWPVEGISKLVDDNLTIPLISGAAGQLVWLVLQGLV